VVIERNFTWPATDPDEHTRFRHRWHLVEGNRLALNLRWLPLWVVSFAVEEANAGIRSEPHTSELVRVGHTRASAWFVARR
jgi:hypothetical protein